MGGSPGRWLRRLQPGGAEGAPRARSWPALGPHGPAALSRYTLLRPPDAGPCLLGPRPLTCWPASRLSLFFCAFLLFLGLYCRLHFALLSSSPPFALIVFCLFSRCLGRSLRRKMMCLTGLLEGRWRSPTVPARFLIEPQPFFSSAFHCCLGRSRMKENPSSDSLNAFCSLCCTI